MKLLIKSLRKDIEDAAPPSDIVFSYETNAIVSSQSPFLKACSKVSGVKSLSEYIKRCDRFVEPLELTQSRFQCRNAKSRYYSIYSPVPNIEFSS